MRRGNDRTQRWRHPYLEWPAPVAVAHRGGALEAPENTMRAFAHAVELGYVFVETDVQVTADGALVVFHDDGLARTCGHGGLVAEMTWRDLRAARVAGTEPIPTFDELLDAWPHTRINVDCKTDAAVEPLLGAIRRHHAFHRVCVAAFSDRRIRRLRSLGGAALCTAAARRELAVLWASGVRTGGLAAQVPARRGRVRVVTARFVARAHHHRLPVHVWTIDDPSEMAHLLDLGVDGILTDRPQVLRDVLVARGQWVQ